MSTIRKIKVGDTLHVFVRADAAAEKLIAKALRTGESVIENGVEQWVEVTALERAGRGSSRYYWHADGNRVECARTIVSKTGGAVWRRRLRNTFRDFQSVT